LYKKGFKNTIGQLFIFWGNNSDTLASQLSLEKVGKVRKSEKAAKTEVVGSIKKMTREKPVRNVQNLTLSSCF
jgi:hypothetical protein